MDGQARNTGGGSGPRGEARPQLLQVSVSPCADPPGLQEGQGGKEVGGAQLWAADKVRERVTGAGAGARGSGVTAASCSVRWMSWGHRTKS